MILNRSELISAVKHKADITNDQAYRAVEAVFSIIAEELENGNNISIQSFGTFEVKDRAARKGVNPSTHQPIEIKASRVPTFKFSYKLKERVNK